MLPQLVMHGGLECAPRPQIMMHYLGLCCPFLLEPAREEGNVPAFQCPKLVHLDLVICLHHPHVLGVYCDDMVVIAN